MCPLAYARWDVPVAQIHRSRLQNCTRLNNWNYAPFFVLLSSAVVVAYADPIALLIERLLAAAGIRGLLVVPALLLILFALLLQQRALHAERDQQVKQDTKAIRGDARRAEERARELEQLVRLGEALTATLDPKAIHQTVTQYLQPVVGQREIWMTVRTEGWRLAIGGPQGVESSPEKAWDPTSQPGAWDTFPMFAAGKLVGLMGVGQTVGDRPQPLSDSQRRLLEMAASLVGLSIKNAQLFRKVRQLSAVDVLTGCLTRHHGMNLIGAELRRAQRSEQPVSLLFIDLDHFKQLNDRYGHLFGDSVLGAVGSAMKEALRGSDLRCRYGGEEFVVLLPDTPLDGAKRVAESMRRHLARKAIKRPEGSIFVTASIGVSAAMPGELDAKALLARSDAAMYRAKRDGRNCVRVWEDYPEWRRSQARETPGTEQPKPDTETEASEELADTPDWRILPESLEYGATEQGAPVEDGDDWDEV